MGGSGDETERPLIVPFRSRLFDRTTRRVLGSAIRDLAEGVSIHEEDEMNQEDMKDVLGVEKILDNGPDEECANLVLMSEGYLENDLRAYRKKCDELVRVIRVEPWYTRSDGRLNVHRVDVKSREPARNVKYNCSSKRRRTAFGFKFCRDGNLKRLIDGEEAKAKSFADRLVPAWACVGILVNTTHRGGTGIPGLFWTSTGNKWTTYALHEMGHAMFYLNDEYGGDAGDLEHDHKHGFRAENVTTETSRDRIPWKNLIPDRVPIPTMRADEDRGRNPLTRDDAGLFEGALGQDEGVYRGCYTCRMRSTKAPFCVVCEDLIVEYFEEKLWQQRRDDQTGSSSGHQTGSSSDDQGSSSDDSTFDSADTRPSPKRVVITVGSFSLAFPNHQSGLRRARQYLDTLPDPRSTDPAGPRPSSKRIAITVDSFSLSFPNDQSGKMRARQYLDTLADHR